MIALSVWQFLRANWKAVAGIGALIALAILFALLRAEKRHSAKLRTQLIACVEARKQDRASYDNAQVAAKAKNEAQVAIIEAESREITNEVSKDYAGDLARLRAELGRVRHEGTAPAQSPARRGQTSAVPETAGRSDETDKLPLSSEDVLRAAEIELQLMHLQTWVELQLKVDRK